MESLQLSQMLADLSELAAAQEAEAAAALVNANKALVTAAAPAPTPPAQQHDLHDSKGIDPHHHRRLTSGSAAGSRTASPAKFDKFDKLGRRIYSPPITRSNSNQGSMPGTPREHDPDVDRAHSIMTLHQIREKLKQQDNMSMLKAREKINALAARQHATLVPTERKDITPDFRHSRFSYPRAN